LKGNHTYPGINSSTWQPIENLNELPYPDFGDYMFSQYQHAGIPICDSRGCVRSCEFCDIIEHWKKYQYRTAENIFGEILHQVKLYGIRKFLFYNSLTNGNMKEFLRLLDLFCAYNEQHPDNELSWEGYFIVRNQKQHSEELWKKIKKSNGILQLGIESVVENVRISLGKNFTNADIDFHLEMAKKYSVPLMLLLIIGYPTETKKDFEFTEQWFKQRSGYFNHPVQSVVLSLAAILPNTQLERRQTDYGIVQGSIPTIWLTTVREITPDDRIDHYNNLSNLIKTFGVTVSGSDDSIAIAKQEITR
jgi:radical SAM superfamily enzyme YgiQ (UPF0313 family)